MTTRVLVLAAAVVQTCSSANLAISTYFKDGFTPTAIASDAQGNLFVAGSAIIDPASQATGVAIAKLDPKAGKYLYLAYLDSAASDQVSAIAVDSAGNAYIAGWTSNPNFPVTGPQTLGTPPAHNRDNRSFLTKLDPNGAVLFSVLLGGSVPSIALALAITPAGQAVVSGICQADGFPSTPGAIAQGETGGQSFLMELDPSATKMVFSATSVGGSSIVLDAAGNIFLAGSGGGTSYPIPLPADRTALVQAAVCTGLCQIGGSLAQVTKIDSTGSKLIYSTGLSDNTGAIVNAAASIGLAVDAAGNAYLTGSLYLAASPLSGGFPVDLPGIYYGFLTKLDPTGSSALFSVPIGGGGVQVDSFGAVYVGGTVSSPQSLFPSFTPVSPPAALAWVPQLCWPDNIVSRSGAYVIKVDPSTGNALDAQWIGGSAPSAVGISLASGKVWITGAALAPDVPLTPGALTPANLGTGFLQGAYLASADFSAGSTAAPVIACVLDSANLTHVRAVAAFQLISLFGAYLGPSTGVAAPDGGDASLAGVSITFDGNPAQLLYVSSSQINVAVPVPQTFDALTEPFTVMQVTVNGFTIPRQFPFAPSNLSEFATLTVTGVDVDVAGRAFPALAANADGSVNSGANPAHYGSTVSLFVQGIGAFNYAAPPPSQLTGFQATVNQCSWTVLDANLIDSFVYKVDIGVPPFMSPCFASYSSSATQFLNVTLDYQGTTIGPLALAGNPQPMFVYVAQ